LGFNTPVTHRAGFELQVAAQNAEGLSASEMSSFKPILIYEFIDMSRRTKQELLKAKERRLKKAKSLLGKKNDSTQLDKKDSDQKKEDDISQLFKEKIGYSLSLVRQDLVKTTVVTILVSLALVAISVLI
jgi:hypothetical protein